MAKKEEEAPLYWGKTGGKYRLIHDAIDSALVPASGEADSKAGEIIRLADNVYYECFNNGGSFYGGQRGDEARKLARMVKKHVSFTSPQLNNDEQWDEMMDASIKAAWMELMSDPASLKKVLAKMP